MAYRLVNVKSGREFEDESGWALDDPDGGAPSLIRPVFEKKQLEVRPDGGLYQFSDWMPIRRELKGSHPPVTYKSDGLAKELGLTNLWITFNGYYPEVGALMSTCSFKETEAYTVCGRFNSDKVLIVQSAGNTARAFAKVCSDNHIPLLLCVPEDNINALWFEHELDPCVKLICSEHGSDYFDAIQLGNAVAKSPRFLIEGGAKNVARRAGMGTTVLSAVTTIKKIPDFYFQAIGSGTGAIAAHEAVLLFHKDGRYGQNMMRLMCSQNAPFLPMYNAWKQDRREIPPQTDDEFRAAAQAIDAKVLSNRKPPYGIAGGLFDCLKEAGGDILSVTNEEAAEAGTMFERCEGIDIHPAAAVATASLIQAVKAGEVPKDACIMLNITGGGEKLFKADKNLFYLKPSIVFPIGTPENEVISRVEELFGFPN